MSPDLSGSSRTQGEPRKSRQELSAVTKSYYIPPDSVGLNPNFVKYQLAVT